MGSSQWTEAASGLASSIIRRGATAAIERPNGGGDHLYGFASVNADDGAVALYANQAGFSPMASGCSVRGAVRRGPATGFAPFLFAGLQGTTVANQAYMLGLADGDPARIILVKAALTAGLADAAPNPPSNAVLMRSAGAVPSGTWVHLRLDVIVQGTGDVFLKCYESNLDDNPVTSPVWTEIAGMELFVDDVLGVNTGTVPLVGGRAGKGIESGVSGAQVWFDHLEVSRQV